MDYNSQGANAQNPAFNSSETTADFYRAIAKHLMSQKGFQMTPEMAKSRGSGALALPDIVNALAAGRYADKARQADLNLRTPSGEEAPQVEPGTLGGKMMKGAGDLASKLASYWQGGGEQSPTSTPDKDLTTGSNAPSSTPEEAELPKYEGKSPEMDAMPNTPGGGVQGTAIPPFQTDQYKDQIKKVENPALYSGKVNSSKAQWDFQQHTNGFGTKALNQTEVIDRAEADKRFDRDWDAAGAQVDKFKPGLAPGTKAALQSLTFNSGTKWMQSGLGEAVQSGDQAKIRNLFLQYNKATDARTGKTTELAGLKERREREVKWMDDDNKPAGVNVRSVPTQAIPGVTPPSIAPGEPDSVKPNYLGAGGVPPNPGEPSAVEPAGGKPFESRAGNATGDENIDIPGYKGPKPTIPYVETPQEIHTQMMHGSPSDAQKVLEDWRNRQKPIDKEVPGGTLHITPKQGGGGDYRFIPSAKDIPLGIAGMNLHMRQNSDGSVRLLLPNGGGKDFSSVSDLLDYARNQKALDIRTEGRASAVTGKYADMEKDIQQRAQGAAVNMQTLQLAKKMSNDPSFYSGTGAEKILDYKKIGSYITGNPNWSGSTEAFGKLLARANIDGLEAFKGYGQIRNPEIELLRESSGNLANTPGAIQAIIDINMRASQRLTEIGDMMREYRDSHPTTGLDEGFEKMMARFYKDHPLYTDDEIKNYKELFKMEKDKGGNKWEESTIPGVRRRKIE